jgi:hypothetical protein
MNQQESEKPIGKAQIEHGLSLWREEAAQLEQRVMSRAWRREYEHAVGLGVAWLGRYRTMTDLIRTYFDLAYLGKNDVDEQGEDPFAVACRQAEEASGTGHILNSSLVEDVSYFRRAQALIAGKPPAGNTEDQSN